nr:unnamed protein product [Callosobruchus analis]
MKYTRILMIMTGCWHQLGISNIIINVLYKTYGMFLQGTFTLFTLSLSIGVKYVFHDSRKLNGHLQFLLVYIFCLWKMALAQSIRIKDLVGEIPVIEQTFLGDEKTKAVHVKVSSYNYKIFTFLGIAGFCTILPFIVLEVLSFKEMKARQELVFAGYFPSYILQNCFGIVFVYQVWNGTLAAIYISCFDTLFNGLAIFIFLRLKVLGKKFERLQELCEMEDPKIVLRSLVIEHLDIIRFTVNVNGALKWYFFGDFLLKSYHISTVLIDLLFLDSFNIACIFSITRMIYLLSMVWCIYYNCNGIIIESEKICDSIYYFSRWYNQSPEIKRTLSIIMTRSQKPLMINIGNLDVMGNQHELSSHNFLRLRNPTTSTWEPNHWLTATGNFIQRCLDVNKVNASDEEALPTIKKCIQKRLLVAVDRAIYSEVIRVGDGVESLVKASRGLEDVEKGNGNGGEWKNRILYKLGELLKTHVLKVKLATITPTRDVEGRGRRKKDMFGHMLMFGLVAAGLIVIPMGFKFLAVLGGKALLLAKMALLLTSIQGLKKIATSNFNYGLYSTFPAQHATGHGPCKQGLARCFRHGDDVDIQLDIGGTRT